ncbi:MULTISPECIES: flagellar hook-associated protein 3 [Bacillus cereus group]|uniref:Flagellar hook-associated protein FlgL n=1 Tax=Bacillus thuringiensis TaxID=1428 RepID=A0A1C4C4W0_BACTU|nr:MULTISPECIES: flagellar hook-associated protein 3 [Bacillus cereus group]MDP1456700.1 flagellar hook-associated protein 3 [Bacillus wiedmannii]MED2013940.1 flagellar hook-associated protein 3 [Bacillus wiedmannii]MED3023784.1 flagellar hook-associated protein 3 [Bacillus wiedmannii]OTX97139.1 flagellar hook-associated protein 3 [Bacillus thuringiensis serovar wratislaviensis]OUB55359.1 flagellar hook-associated protein 3 [Bacillus thuringiensis serovar sylvestriensis]
MRVSTFQNANWAKNQLMDLNVQQQYHRNQVTSGKKNLLMSEDPLAASKSFAIQHSLANIEQMQKDIADSRNVLSQTENTLQGIVKSLTRVDQLTVQALNGTNSEKELKAIGAEVDQILKQVVYLANTKEQGRYLFGGNSAGKPPFADDGTYQGGNEDVMWKLNDGYEIKAFRKGEDLLTPAIQTLVKMKDTLQSGDQKALQPFLEENKKNLDSVINRTTEVGSTMNTVDTFKTILSEQNLALQENRKEIEDVDLAAAISELAYINATYEATLKAVSTMSKTSILDYM